MDTQTLLLTVGVLYLLLPISTWLVLLRQRSVQGDLWCLGGLVGGIGMILFSLRGMLPDLISFPVANTLMIFSFLLRIRSLQLDLFTHQRDTLTTASNLMDWLTSPGGIALLTLLYVAGYLPLYVNELDQWLGLWTRILTVLACGCLVWLAARLAHALHSRNAAAIAVVYALFTLAMAVVVIMTLTGHSSTIQPTSRPEFGIIGALLALASIVGHLSYLGLAIEAAARTSGQLETKTARAEALRDQAEALALSDRRHSLGQLSGALSHEIRQPLTTVSIMVQLAKRQLASGQDRSVFTEPDPPLPMLESMVVDLRKANSLIDQIRSFVQPVKDSEQRFDVCDTIRSTIDLLKQTLLERRMRVETSLPAQPVIWQGDSVQIIQILLHAIRNATTLKQIDGATSAGVVQLRLNVNTERLEIEVECDGRYDPAPCSDTVGFQAISSDGSDTDFGMMMIDRIVETLEGQIFVDNLPNGTRIRILLPRRE